METIFLPGNFGILMTEMKLSMYVVMLKYNVVLN